MKIPISNNLNNIPITNPNPPTLYSETQGQEIILEMIDGTLGVYQNEGGFILYGKFTNWDQFKEETGLSNNDEMHTYDKSLTKDIQNVYKNVVKVYTAEL